MSEALREGRIDLSVSNNRPVMPEVKVQNLFSTQFVGLVREDHPLLDQEITAERFAGYSHISMFPPRHRPWADRCGPQRLGAGAAGGGDCAEFPCGDVRFARFRPDSAGAPGDAAERAQTGAQVAFVHIANSIADHRAEPGLAPALYNDPAHRWLRETLKACCDETWLAAQP